MIKKLIALIFFVYISTFTDTYALQCTDSIAVKNICENQSCSATSEQFVQRGANFNYLDNTNIIEIDNVSIWIKSEIQQNVLEGNNETFTFEYFCEDGHTSCTEKTFTLEDFLLLETSFQVKDGLMSLLSDEYNNGLEYFFTNYKDFLGVEATLGDIIQNLEFYSFTKNKHKYSLKNLCQDTNCSETKYRAVYGNSTKGKQILTGVKKELNYNDISQFGVDSLIYSDSSVDIGSEFDVTFTFIDDYEKAGCSKTYNYNISYVTDSGDKILEHGDIILGETHYSNGKYNKTFNTNVVINEIGDFPLKVEIIDEYENLILKQTVTGIKVNAIAPSEVKSDIVVFNFDSNKSYYEEDVLTARIYLRDINENSYGDSLYGINITHTDENVEFLEGTEFGNKSDTDIYGNSFFDFSFSFKSEGEYSKGFQISVPKIDSNGNIIGGQETNLTLGDISTPFTIKKIVVSEINNLHCAQRMRVQATCSLDVFSGCSGFVSQTPLFDSESFNTNDFTLSATDNAGVVRYYTGRMDHIDRTAPDVEFMNVDTTFKADSNLVFSMKIQDPNPRGCEDIAEVKYKVELEKNGGGYTEIKTGTIVDIKRDTKEVEVAELNGIFSQIGDYKIKVVVEDAVGNIGEYIHSFEIYPADISPSNTSISVSHGSNVYANNSDSFNYTLTLKDIYNNPIIGKNVTYFNQEQGSITGDFKTLTSDNNEDVLFENYNMLSNNSGEITIPIKSLTPGFFTQRFRIKMNRWDDNFNDVYGNFDFIKSISGEKEFAKPVSLSVGLQDTSQIPQLGINQIYGMNLTNVGTLTSISGGSLDFDYSNIELSSGFSWETFNILDDIFGSNLNETLRFDGTIDTNSSFLDSPTLHTRDVVVRYTIDGKVVSYSMDNYSATNGTCNIETLGVKVYGTIEGEGKSGDVGQVDNFSDLSKSQTRLAIRKNAYGLINRTPDNTQTINGVMYIEGGTTDYSSISAILSSNDTLIIKDGNLNIDENINTNVGIIILKDNYSAESDYNTTGNIYVAKNVTNINAMVYADGSFRSAKSDGTVYSETELNLVLNFKGSVFTKNTIGGSVGITTLPGGKQTSEFLAGIFDLNNVRKIPKSCDGDDTNDYSFIITYNPQIQTNPPKGFGN